MADKPATTPGAAQMLQWLGELAQAMEEIADIAQRPRDPEVTAEWAAASLPDVEALHAQVEQLQAATRRARHALRSSVASE